MTAGDVTTIWRHAGWGLLATVIACTDLTGPLVDGSSPAPTTFPAYGVAAQSTGDVFIILQTDPDGAAGTFTFEHDFGASSNPEVATPFSLGDGQLAIFNSVAAGSYSATLTVPPDWELVPSGDGHDTECSDEQANSSIDLSTGVATIDVSGNETVICTFVLRSGGDGGDGGDSDPPAANAPLTMAEWRTRASCSTPATARRGRAAGSSTTLEFYLSNYPAIFPLGLITSMDCDQATRILFRHDFDGTNRANDAAFTLAAQLLVTRLNQAAGAAVPSCVADVMSAAQDLLGNPPSGIGFTGTGAYLGPKSDKQRRATATALALVLTRYNSRDSGVLANVCRGPV